MKLEMISSLAISLSLITLPAFSKESKKPQTPAGSEAITKDLDLNLSKIMWNGKKVTGEHTGEIKLKDGTITVKGKDIVAGKFDIDMSTITDTDLKDPEYNKK